MKTSRLIQILAEYIQEHGDIEVRLFVDDEAGGEYSDLDELWLNLHKFPMGEAIVISAKEEDQI